MTLKTADMPIDPKVTREKTYLESSLSSLNNSMSNINSASNNSNSSPERSRFGGGKSYNMFFIRHTAQPRNLRLMTGKDRYFSNDYQLKITFDIFYQETTIFSYVL